MMQIIQPLKKQQNKKMKQILLIGLLLSAIFSNGQFSGQISKVKDKEVCKLLNVQPHKNDKGKIVKHYYDMCFESEDSTVRVVKGVPSHIMREPNWCSHYLLTTNKQGYTRVEAVGKKQLAKLQNKEE